MVAWLYYSPFGQAISLLLVSTVLMAIFRRFAVAIALVAVCLYVLANPVINGILSDWWLRTLASIPALILLVLFAALLVGKLRKGTMEGGATAFVLPLVIYPPMVVVSGVVRLAFWMIRG